MRTLKGRAYAKINLTLEVLGRYPDGYHALVSVFHTLTLYDEIALSLFEETPFLPLPLRQGEGVREAFETVPPTSGGNLTEGGSSETSSTPRTPLLVQGFPVPTDERNTIWKAITEFFAEISLPTPEWRASLIKHIPTQAGLGGGSSDAGTLLRWLADLYRVPESTIDKIALRVGSDVPFFVKGYACALVEGRGEHVIPLPPLPPFWWVLAKPPGVGISTAWAYHQLGRPPLQGDESAPATERLVSAIRQGIIHTPEDLAGYLQNDFEAVVLPASEPLQKVRQAMEKQGLLRVLLCGSGAVQAGLCHDQHQAESVAQHLRQQRLWSIAVQFAQEGGVPTSGNSSP